MLTSPAIQTQWCKLTKDELSEDSVLDYFDTGVDCEMEDNIVIWGKTHKILVGEWVTVHPIKEN